MNQKNEPKEKPRRRDQTRAGQRNGDEIKQIVRGYPRAFRQLSQVERLIEARPGELVHFGPGGVESKRERGVQYTLECHERRLNVWFPNDATVRRARRIAKEFFAGKGASCER